ncbi:MAG: ribonuclease T [Gammaproteobacteria bacterium]|nr:ribonuclease T [Gammaproteobacteria bacterium]
MPSPESPNLSLSQRFRGFLPVVVDVETAGFNAYTDALLEIAAVTVTLDSAGRLVPEATFSCHVEPFAGANLDPRSLEFTGIDPYHPFRMAVTEREALERVFAPVRERVKQHGCTRAILVGHNPFFDLGFIKAAVERTGNRKNPFHSFTTFDTATLAGLAFGQTVLARAAAACGIEWDQTRAHSAVYDAERTAELFCAIVNRWDALSGGIASLAEAEPPQDAAGQS